jgi:hypothetical protein
MNVLEKNIKSTGEEIKSYNFHRVDQNTFEKFIQHPITKNIYTGTTTTIEGKKLLFDDNKRPVLDEKVFQQLRKEGILPPPSSRA